MTRMIKHTEEITEITEIASKKVALLHPVYNGYTSNFM
jgi:hypothetical protein